MAMSILFMKTPTCADPGIAASTLVETIKAAWYLHGIPVTCSDGVTVCIAPSVISNTPFLRSSLVFIARRLEMDTGAEAVICDALTADEIDGPYTLPF